MWCCSSQWYVTWKTSSFIFWMGQNKCNSLLWSVCLKSERLGAVQIQIKSPKSGGGGIFQGCLSEKLSRGSILPDPRRADIVGRLTRNTTLQKAGYVTPLIVFRVPLVTWIETKLITKCLIYNWSVLRENEPSRVKTILRAWLEVRTGRLCLFVLLLFSLFCTSNQSQPRSRHFLTFPVRLFEKQPITA